MTGSYVANLLSFGAVRKTLKCLAKNFQEQWARELVSQQRNVGGRDGIVIKELALGVDLNFVEAGMVVLNKPFSVFFCEYLVIVWSSAAQNQTNMIVLVKLPCDLWYGVGPRSSISLIYSVENYQRSTIELPAQPIEFDEQLVCVGC